MAWSFISENIPQPWHQAEFSAPAYLPDVTSTVLDCGTGREPGKGARAVKGDSRDSGHSILKYDFNIITAFTTVLMHIR